MTGRRRRQAGATWIAPLVGLVVGAIALLLVKGCGDDHDPVPLPSQQAASASAPSPQVTFAAAHSPVSPAPASSSTPASSPLIGKPGLIVHNPCQQPLMLALNYQNAQRQRVTAGFYPIAGGLRVALQGPEGAITPHDGLVYFYTETPESEPVETGRQTQTVGDREVAMKRLNLDAAAPAAIELECPGMTSGKP